MIYNKDTDKMKILFMSSTCTHQTHFKRVFVENVSVLMRLATEV